MIVHVRLTDLFENLKYIFRVISLENWLLQAENWLLINKRFLFYILVLLGSAVLSTIFFTALYAGKDVGSHDLLFLIEEYGYILLGFTMTALAGVVFEIFATPKLQDPHHYGNSIQQADIRRLSNLLSDLDLNETTPTGDRAKRFRNYGLSIPVGSSEQCVSLI